jgi:hypothetical protein
MARETHDRPIEERLRHHQFMDRFVLRTMRVMLGAPFGELLVALR